MVSRMRCRMDKQTDCQTPRRCGHCTMSADLTFTQAAHMTFVRTLAETNPAEAFKEADMMAMAESSNEVKAEWMKLALEIQKEMQ